MTGEIDAFGGKGSAMYLPTPRQTWPARLAGSLRTLVAIVLTALLASALTVRLSDDAFATGAGAVAQTANAIPVTLEGVIVGAGDGTIALVEQGAESPIALTVGEESRLVRGGAVVALEELLPGDAVRATIDGRSGAVMQLTADPTAGAAFRVPGAAAFLAALGLIAGATALAWRNIERVPALSSRVAVSRLLPVQAAR